MTTQAPRATQFMPAPTKRYGLLPMPIGSSQLIERKVGDRKVMERCDVRDARKHAGATGHYVCLHKACRGKSWVRYDDLVKDHATTEEMIKDQEAHVFGLWSDDVDKDEKEGWGKSCSDCRTVTKVEDGKQSQQRVVCFKHQAPCPPIGLLSYDQPPAPAEGVPPMQVTEDLAKAIASNPELLKAITDQLAKNPPAEARAAKKA